MKKFSFAKMSGAGNDFILFDRKITPSLELNPESIKSLCSRRTGIGADGILVISDYPGYNFSLEYYNSDGSTGTLCGNGSRCAIRYAHLTNRDDNNLVRFISNGKDYRGEILDPLNTKFFLNEPENISTDLKLNVFGQVIPAAFINTGSPHVIISINEVAKNSEDTFYRSLLDFPVFELGRKIRYLQDFAPGGTNVNFIKAAGNYIQIRTYERGVEDETLACGTGSTAAALIASIKYGAKPPITLKTQSGDELVVDFECEGDKFRNVSLTGPAEVTFTGEFYSTMYFNNLEK